MGDINYIIKYESGKKKKKQHFVKCFHGYKDDTWYSILPGLSPEALLITDAIFSTEEKAEEELHKNIQRIKKRYPKRNKPVAAGRRPKFDRSIEWYKAQEFIERDRYVIVEYAIEYAFKEKKIAKHEWVKDKGLNKYCNACGTSMPSGRYFEIRSIKLCLFCLRQLGLDSTVLIKEVKKEDPEFEDNYHVTSFLGHL